MHTQFRFWWRWLVAVTVGVMLFGLSMVVAPGLIRQVFGLLLYADPAGVDAFGAPAVSYITLLHGVLGAVMFGWAVALCGLLWGPFRRRAPDAWLTVVISLAAWFVPDTAFSLWTGFWQNAVLNAVLMLLFAVPLAVTYRDFYHARLEG